MKTTFSTYKTRLSVLSFPSRSDAIAYLGRSNFIDLTDTASEDYQCHFRVVEYQNGMQYLLASETDDDLLIIPYSEENFIWAYDHFLYSISLEKWTPNWIHDCGEPIWNVLISNSRILVHTELGLRLLNHDGTMQWEVHFGELIGDVRVDNGAVIVEDFYRKTSRLSLETGQQIEPRVGVFSR